MNKSIEALRAEVAYGRAYLASFEAGLALTEADLAAAEGNPISQEARDELYRLHTEKHAARAAAFEALCAVRPGLRAAP